MPSVVGGTGNVGRELRKQLSGLGEPARFLVRGAEKAAEATAMGFEAAIGDISEIETIEGALADADRIFS